MPPYDSTTVASTRPALTRTTDFFSFWSDTLAELAQTTASPRLGVAVTAPAGDRIVPVRFGSLHGGLIQGFLITHDEQDVRTPPPPRPLIISSHGYNSSCNPVLAARHASTSGADLFCFDVRGCGRSRAACEPNPRGFILSGLANPQTCILRGAVCDYVRAAEVARLVQGGESGPLIFHGRSFGGGLALMAQAVSRQAAYLPIAVPTFGWAAGRRRLVTAGSGLEINLYLQDHPSEETTVMNTLSYFDTMNFADQVGCRALVGVGRRDAIVPPETVYAVVNHMVPSPEVVEMPVSHTDDIEERQWVRFDQRWSDDVAALAR